MTTEKKTGEYGRPVMVRFRVSLLEKSALIESAREAGLSMSDWLRQKAIGSKPRLRGPSPDREILLGFMATMGRNTSLANQIARQLNRKQENFEFEIPIRDIELLIAEMKQLTDTLRTLYTYGNSEG